jgi:hypothetical protein
MPSAFRGRPGSIPVGGRLWSPECHSRARCGKASCFIFVGEYPRHPVGICVGIGSNTRNFLFSIQSVMVLGDCRPGAPSAFAIASTAGHLNWHELAAFRLLRRGAVIGCAFARPDPGGSKDNPDWTTLWRFVVSAKVVLRCRRELPGLASCLPETSFEARPGRHKLNAGKIDDATRRC